jgi:hypothetical protein
VRWPERQVRVNRTGSNAFRLPTYLHLQGRRTVVISRFVIVGIFIPLLFDRKLCSRMKQRLERKHQRSKQNSTAESSIFADVKDEGAQHGKTHKA